MKGKRVIVYAGTTEGRLIIEDLISMGAFVHACVATEYGDRLILKHENLRVTHERQDVDDMRKLFCDYRPDYVVDATHPYAQVVTENIKEACAKSENNIPYLRLLRKKSKIPQHLQDDKLILVDSITKAVDYLKNTAGNILVTTGSKELEAYTALSNYKERVYARVLSVKNVVEKCQQLGIEGRHLICMQGPFSLEMNKVMLQDFDIHYMVTKESGAVGGFEEKWQAAKKTETTLIVVGRPIEEKGYSYEELREYFQNQS